MSAGGAVVAVNDLMSSLLGGPAVSIASFPQPVARALEDDDDLTGSVDHDGWRWSLARVGTQAVVQAQPAGPEVESGVARDERLAAIVALHQDLACADFDADGIVQWVVERSRILFGDKDASLGLVMGDLVVYTNVTRATRERVENSTLLDDSLAGLCIRSGRTMSSDDVEQDPRVDLTACQREGARSMVIVPLRHQGQVVGVLNVHSPQPHAFSPSDVATVEQVGGVVSAAYGHAADLTAKRELLAELERTLSALQHSQAQLVHDALHDPLTGLANRVLFLDRLRGALAASARNGQGVAVLFLDVDRFKAVNDRLGHAAGDALLRTVGSRISDCLRSTDTAARFGGDEFTALCTGADGVEAVLTVAKRITSCIGRPVALQGGEAVPTVSIGIAWTTGGSASAEGLLKRADLALYRAKAAGRNRVEVDDLGDGWPVPLAQGL